LHDHTVLTGNAFGRHFLRQRHGKSVDSGLGGGVVGLTELALSSRETRDSRCWKSVHYAKP
jgi:hypothetical protein